MARSPATPGVLLLVLLAPACTGTVVYNHYAEDSVDGGSTHDDAGDDPLAPLDAAAGAPDSSAAADAAATVPLAFNIILRQTVQACSGCGIWFDWQGVQSQKPRLVIEYQHLGQLHTVEYQHGLNGMDNAHSCFLNPANDGAVHSLLVKQSPQSTGLFRADISDIPVDATIVSATLHLHIETHEGLAYSDTSSVLEVHACDRPWRWDQVTWTHYASGLAWSQAGGDFGAVIREIRAKEDLVDRGFSKANPDANFDFTAHVQELQAAR